MDRTSLIEGFFSGRIEGLLSDRDGLLLRASFFAFFPGIQRSHETVAEDLSFTKQLPARHNGLELSLKSAVALVFLAICLYQQSSLLFFPDQLHPLM
jgi:hypothetical protein